ncbi:MAG: hypothetical protein KA327_11850, partial [Pseudarcicella sp.]|nr:hypothetical protein [Pseudarcicella sp.]
MKHFYIFLYLFLLGFSQVLTSQNRAKVISSHGYDNCIELTNQWVRVVLEPNLGGRVLVYEKNGRNVLYVDTLQNGFVNTKKTANIQPAAGRFDIGPESVQKKRLALWTGKYSFKILSNSKVMLQSPADSVSGFQITRIFELGSASSLLRCQQIVKNISNKTQMACHWGRTFALGGGIALSPQNPMSRFPKGYCIYRPPNKTIDFSPTPEPNV